MLQSWQNLLLDGTYIHSKIVTYDTKSVLQMRALVKICEKIPALPVLKWKVQELEIHLKGHSYANSVMQAIIL